MSPHELNASISIASLQRLALLAATQKQSIDEMVASMSMVAPVTSTSGRYRLRFFEEELVGETLAEWMGVIVDHVQAHWPCVLVDFERAGTRRGARISRRRDLVHYLRPDLPVFETKTGWFVSANISRRQTIKWIKVLAETGGWTFGKDLRILT